MLHEFSRTELLIGHDALECLAHSTVAVFGIGGVGSYAVEALARSGVGRLILIDNDCVCLTNLNRQIHATHRSIGKPKVEVMKERILDINPRAEVITHQIFYMPEYSSQIFQDKYDYIVDAIDTVTAKIDLIINAKQKNIPIISSMGTGNKLDPSRLEISDIYATSVCPLARVMRRELGKRGIKDLKVVYSKEIPIKPTDSEEKPNNYENLNSSNTEPAKRPIPGSIAFVPPVAGLLIASEVVKDLIQT